MKIFARSRGVGLCLYIALCISCAPLAAWARTPFASPSSMPPSAPPVQGGLSLARALELAYERNPELAVARFELEATAGARQQAGVFPNPELAYSLEDTERQYRSTTLQFDQLIELGGKRAARMRIAEYEHAIASELFVEKRHALRAALISAYYDLMSARERVRLAEQGLDIARRANQAAARRIEAGKLAPIEETKARVAQSGAQLELSQARSEAASAQARLAAILGESEEGAIALDTPLDTSPGALWGVPSVADLEQAIEDAPALRRARLELGRRQALSGLEKARRIPDLTVSLGAKRSEELGRNQAIVGLRIPLPLFDGNQGALLEALGREEKAREELAGERLRIATAAAQLRERLLALRDEARLLAQDVLPGAEDVYAATVKGFDLGKFSFLETLDAQRTLLQARLLYLRARAESHRARAELERLLGIEETLGE
jgi:cobalt-zinc-cadmium efflux system outer membrane protein